MDYALILSTHYADSEWVLSGNDYEGLTWLSESPKPSQVELEKLWVQTEKALQLDAIKQARLLRFQQEADPIFFQFKRGQATEKAWLDAVKKIETELPLP